MIEGTFPYFISPRPDGRLEFCVDNHLISTFVNCEAKFHLQHIRRMRPKGMGGVALNIGSWWSAVLGGHDVIHNEQPIHIFGLYELMQTGKIPSATEFASVAGLLWREMHMDDLEKSKPLAFKTFGGADGAARMALEYYGKHALLDFASWKFVGTELGFGRRGEVFIYEDDKIVIYYMGKPDLIVISNGVLQPVEHKTVDRIMRNSHLKYKPHPQIAGYIYAIKEISKQLGWDGPTVDRCIVNVAGRMPPADNPRDGVRKPRFLRVFPNYSEPELQEWRENITNKVKRLHNCLLTNQWTWNEQSCHLYGGCEYRGVHAAPPGSREFALQSDFVQVQPWTPYTTDEDEDDE